MVLNIRNREADRLARQLAQMDQTGLTEAVVLALKEAIARRLKADSRARSPPRFLKDMALRFSRAENLSLPPPITTWIMIWVTRAMFVDACAIVSLIAGEDDSADYEQALQVAEHTFTSALAAWEAIIVLSRPDQLNCRFSQTEEVVVEWLAATGISLREAGDPREVLHQAVLVAEEKGIGKRHLSNFDCFHYAFAKTVAAPMLTSDRLLKATDLVTLP